MHLEQSPTDERSFESLGSTVRCIRLRTSDIVKTSSASTMERFVRMNQTQKQESSTPVLCNMYIIPAYPEVSKQENTQETYENEDYSLSGR